MSESTRWYFCLPHHRVEPAAGCPPAQRLGPYPDEATAARALDIVRENNAKADAWDGED